MSAAPYLQRLVGKTGIHVVTRLLGIILAALAVQFVLNGLAATPFFRHL
jgi:multiple antibiotic resistance protein